MRCNECNVDLGEEYTKCPLCGAAAVNDEPKLKGIKTAQYPKYDEALLSEKAKYHPTFPQKYVFRICALTSVVLMIISGILSKSALSQSTSNVVLLGYFVPGIMTVSSIFYFLYAFKENSRLIHSAVSLLATVVTLAIFTVITAIAFAEIKTMLIAFALSAVLFIVLFICKPERVKEQLKATFQL